MSVNYIRSAPQCDTKQKKTAILAVLSCRFEVIIYYKGYIALI